MVSTTQTRDRPQTKSTITSADDSRLHLSALIEYTIRWRAGSYSLTEGLVGEGVGGFAGRNRGHRVRVQLPVDLHVLVARASGTRWAPPISW
jgi:hypothetical protein